MKQCFLVDFDGTICETDLGDLLVFEALREWWHDHVENMGQLGEQRLQHNYAIWDRVHLDRETFFSFITQHARPRDGFIAWYQRTQELGAPVYVISAGLASYVIPCVDAWTKNQLAHDHILTVPCQAEGPFAHVRPDLERVRQHPTQTGYAKGIVAKHLRELHPDHQMIVIGDGRSDLQMAFEADEIYARRKLADLLVQEGRGFYPFDSFQDIPPLLDRTQEVRLDSRE